jgi:hypothetical protein
MYTKHLVYAANLTTFYYNAGLFYHKEGKKRMEREIGVQNVQTESVFLDYKTKSKKASKL